MSTSRVVRSEREELCTFVDLSLGSYHDRAVASSPQRVFSNRIFMWLPVKNQNSGTRRHMSSHGSAMTAGSPVLLDSSALLGRWKRIPDHRNPGVRQAVTKCDVAISLLNSLQASVPADCRSAAPPTPHEPPPRRPATRDPPGALEPGRKRGPRADGAHVCPRHMAAARRGRLFPCRQAPSKSAAHR